MPNKETLLELADRVEALDGPCREMDAEIFVMEMHLKTGRSLESIAWLNDPLMEGLPEYTASLDASMTLVPEGFLLNNLFNDGHARGFFNNRKPCGAILNPPKGERVFGYGNSIYNAICAAALRAIASQD
ncbi:hypothetical protein [Litorimonas sp.]|uniref:hypothetical protein n=1 Tax=Litorimonas sp. TaxID=1892381 RepID=UPI003A854E67